MALIKTANAALLRINPYVEGVTQKLATRKVAGVVEKYDPNYVYSVVIGIQGDVFNENGDCWPWEDTLMSPHKTLHLAHQYESWKGKPNCYGHKNDGPSDHYGHVVDTWHVNGKTASANGAPTEVKDVLMVLATDRRRNPLLVSSIESGMMNSVSMGCAVGYSACSVCGNKASDPKEFCHHIKHQKGWDIPVPDGMNVYAGAVKYASTVPLVHVGEVCYDITGVEMSWVPNPAFPGCLKLDQLRPNPMTAARVHIPESPMLQAAQRYERASDPHLKAAGKLLRKAASQKELDRNDGQEILQLLRVLKQIDRTKG